MVFESSAVLNFKNAITMPGQCQKVLKKSLKQFRIISHSSPLRGRKKRQNNNSDYHFGNFNDNFLGKKSDESLGEKNPS
jgi:hypothetical protein